MGGSQMGEEGESFLSLIFELDPFADLASPSLSRLSFVAILDTTIVLPNLPRSTSASPFPQSQPHPSFANPTSYLHNPQQHSYNAPTPSYSPAPPSAAKRRFTSSSNLAGMAGAGPRTNLERGAVDDGRSGKRSRMDESEEEGMELDQLAEREMSRGTKRRMRRTGEGESKRRKGEEEGEEEEVVESEKEDRERDAMDEDDVPSSAHPSSAWSRKHVRSSPTASEEAEAEGQEKRRRSDRKGGKRVIEDVNSSDEDAGSEFEDEEEEGDGRRVARNADSEVESASEEEEDEEESTELRNKSKRHDSKRARSTSIAERTGSEDESVMGDDDPSSLPPPRRQQLVPSSGTTPRKRISTSSTKKSGASAARSGSRFKDRAAPRKMSSLAQRTAGEEWVNLEGDRCRMDGEGMVRKLAEVREMRRRYKVRFDDSFALLFGRAQR